MNIHRFNRRLEKALSKENPSDRLAALARSGKDLQKLRTKDVPSRWNAVFDALETRYYRGVWVVELEEANLLGSLTAQLKQFAEEQRPSCLDRIENRAQANMAQADKAQALNSTKRYYETLFEYLVRDGLGTLSGQARLDRFDKYLEAIERDLSQLPRLLGRAIVPLARATSSLDGPLQAERYDKLNELSRNHLREYVIEKKATYPNLVDFYAEVLKALGGALAALPQADLMEKIDLDFDLNRLEDRLADLRSQADALPYDQQSAVFDPIVKVASKLTPEVFSEPLANMRKKRQNPDIRRFSFTSHSPRDTVRGILRRFSRGA